MTISCRRRGLPSLVLAAASALFGLVAIEAASAGEYLVADRVLGRVLRYSEDGTFIGDLLNDPALGVGKDQRTGGGISSMTLSPDQSKLFVVNRLGNQIHVYDYNGTSATPAAVPLITAGTIAPSTMFIPGVAAFSPDGGTLYISNLGADMIGFPNSTQIARINPTTYASLGADLSGGLANGRSGMAFAPDGDLLVSMAAYFAPGGVVRFDGNVSPPTEFISARPELSTAGGLLVVGDDLYVAAGGGNRVGKFDVNTGAIDTSFDGDGYVTDLTFASSLALGPGGNSFLVTTLGAFAGDSRIAEFDFDGNYLGDFALTTHLANHPDGDDLPPGASFGFSEPTWILHTTVIPEPATATLFGVALVGIGLAGRRSRRRAD